MQWEYYTCQIISPGADLESYNARMEQLGLDQWELCGVGSLSNDSMYRMFFKRQKHSTTSSPYR